MLERASLFLLGGGAYAALELAWRGTTHWTMFLTGGVCLCLLQALADRPLPLGPAAAVGAAGVSGLELAVGAVCRRVLHTAVWDYADEWGNLAGLVCPKYTAYWFLLCGWVILCCAVLKVPFITLKNPPPGIKVQIIVLPVWYNKKHGKQNRTQKGGIHHDPAVQICRRPHRSLCREWRVPFSADTMQEAWEGTVRVTPHTRNVRMYTMPK